MAGLSGRLPVDPAAGGRPAADGRAVRHAAALSADLKDPAAYFLAAWLPDGREARRAPASSATLCATRARPTISRWRPCSTRPAWTCGPGTTPAPANCWTRSTPRSTPTTWPPRRWPPNYLAGGQPTGGARATRRRTSRWKADGAWSALSAPGRAGSADADAPAGGWRTAAKGN